MLSSDTRHLRIDITDDDFADTLISEELAEAATISPAEYEDSVWVRVCTHRDMHHHLVVGPLVRITQLDDSVEEEDFAPVAVCEDLYVLIGGFLVVEDISR